jgi:hypothetical protein
MQEVHSQLRRWAMLNSAILAMVVSAIDWGIIWYYSWQWHTMSDEQILLIAFAVHVIAAFLVGLIWGHVNWEVKRGKILNQQEHFNQ